MARPFAAPPAVRVYSAAMNTITAKWIWNAQRDYNVYNDTVAARREFSLRAFRQAVMRITADSYYRLRINGRWVNDGPCRAWPEHYQYDQIDVTPYLQVGSNEVEIVASYYGVGTFHQRPQQAGLLAQIDVELADGTSKTIGTDRQWQVAPLAAKASDTAKVSAQMRPFEWYDARLDGRHRFRPAAELFAADQGPWQGLHPRDVALLTRRPFEFKSFLGANLIRRPSDLHFCLASGQLVHPGLVEANSNTLVPAGMATVVRLKKRATLRIEGAFEVSIGGRPIGNKPVTLTSGKHLLLATVAGINYHYRDKEILLRDVPKGFTLENPLDRTSENPWCFVSFAEYAPIQDDMVWISHNDATRQTVQQYEQAAGQMHRQAVDVEAFLAAAGDRAQSVPSHKMFVRQSHWQFLDRDVVGRADAFVDNPAALMHDNPEMTTVRPAGDHDIELVYDLGEQNCGYYDFELLADEGVEVDFFGIEYMSPAGQLQHTRGNHNGMRYLTRGGLNRYTSFTRRGGRYVFVTLRNLKSPVKIRMVRLIESTYPVDYVGSFSCSNENLRRIWEISARTLKLCMEDTFTDCPVYEQTLWVGDARNEAIFAFDAFGATDIARRCIRLAAQSLERYPLVGCQVPSSWDCFLPAWSFMWGMSVWDYYFYADDKQFLRECWPAAMENLRNAQKLCTDDGLFTGPFWNIFDWTYLDQDRHTVLHNSMLLVGAIDAALRCADVLGRARDTAWLREFGRDLRKAINARWDASRQGYPDAILEDGSPSPVFSMHTSLLSILYDIAGRGQKAGTLRNLLDPPAGVVGLGTGFVMLYYFDALEKAGHPERIVEAITRDYQTMLDADATTVWEVFPWSPTRPKGMYTRSHCHAWSATPVHYLPRVILGIRQTAPGGAAYTISPRPCGLTHAEGTIATARGPLRVAWQLDGKTLSVEIDAPPETTVRFTRNDTHKGLKIRSRVR